jgi:hypothetical protein
MVDFLYSLRGGYGMDRFLESFDGHIAVVDAIKLGVGKLRAEGG